MALIEWVTPRRVRLASRRDFFSEIRTESGLKVAEYNFYDERLGVGLESSAEARGAARLG
jgi:hypothetical protein